MARKDWWGLRTQNQFHTAHCTDYIQLSTCVLRKHSLRLTDAVVLGEATPQLWDS
jgi:hypothetical protein